MPDLTIVTMQQCKSVYQTVTIPGSKGAVWHVRLDGYRGPYCDCPDYARGSRRDAFYDCKHIRKVGDHACLWHEQVGPEIPNDEPVCPRCSGPTEYVQVGV